MVLDWEKLCASKDSEGQWEYWEDDLWMGKEEKKSIRYLNKSLKSILVIAIVKE